jgi:hypothetical protein
MSEAAKARRRYRREEWATQTTLARLLTRYLDPQTVFWTSLENKPSSRFERAVAEAAGRAERASRHDGRLSSAKCFR